MNLLVVEDEARIAAFVVKGLEAEGYHVEHVSTGGEALTAAHDRDLDLIILDLGLPDIDGIDVLRRLRRAGKNAPVIILTARSGIPERTEGFDSGADVYMTKPFAFADLTARVRACLLCSERAVLP